MEPLSRAEIKELFSETIAPFVTEVRGIADAHEKEIERLTKQSTEHYANFKMLEDKMSKQILQCQTHNSNIQEKAGMRTGDIENTLARHDQRMTEIENDVAEIKSGSRWGKEMWIIIGVALFAPAVTKIILGG